MNYDEGFGNRPSVLDVPSFFAYHRQRVMRMGRTSSPQFELCCARTSFHGAGLSKSYYYKPSVAGGQRAYGTDSGRIDRRLRRENGNSVVAGTAIGRIY